MPGGRSARSGRGSRHGRRAHGPGGRTLKLAVITAAICAAGAMFNASVASAQSVDQCIATKVADGMTRPEAIAACVATDKPTATTTSKAPTTIDRSSSSDSDSTVTTALVSGMLGALAGAAVVATILRGRRRDADREVRSSSSLPAPAPLAVVHNAMPPPGVAVDRSARLIDALIDLADRVPSAALRTDIDNALGEAGVRRIDVTPGTAFDAATMRGVGTVPASDGS